MEKSPTIAFSATNPCHVYDLAVALHRQHALRRYYSGYPTWRLHPPAGFPITTRSFRTVIMYGLFRLPRALYPHQHRLLRWQDTGFDRAVAEALDNGDGDFVHTLPGQALCTLRAARTRGWRTVLNHASGPTRQQLALVEPEFRRAGLTLADHHRFDDAYFAREDAEYGLADFHCAASSVVRDQLIAAGVPAERIWVVPYAANPQIFFPPPSEAARPPLRLVYAGALTQRKGLRVLFAAARSLRASHAIELHLYGPPSPDIAPDLAAVAQESWIVVHGAVSQAQLADAFRGSTLLVLPSWEEAFGLVVPQALNCGLPCIVSSRVGAGDLIRPRQNGSVFPVGDAAALAAEIDWWLRHRGAFSQPALTWDGPARQLLELTQRASA